MAPPCKPQDHSLEAPYPKQDKTMPRLMQSEATRVRHVVGRSGQQYNRRLPRGRVAGDGIPPRRRRWRGGRAYRGGERRRQIRLASPRHWLRFLCWRVLSPHRVRTLRLLRIPRTRRHRPRRWRLGMGNGPVRPTRRRIGGWAHSTRRTSWPIASLPPMAS